MFHMSQTFYIIIFERHCMHIKYLNRLHVWHSGQKRLSCSGIIKYLNQFHVWYSGQKRLSYSEDRLLGSKVIIPPGIFQWNSLRKNVYV